MTTLGRGQRLNPYPGLNQVLTPILAGFPSSDATPYSWTLDVDAVDWSGDLMDNTLSLAMNDENNQYSYVYWYGSDVTSTAPKLTIQYSVPEPSTLVLLAAGAIALAAYAWRRKQAHVKYFLDLLPGKK